jgi:hypoxanthine phosphoribosyltransferase
MSNGTLDPYHHEHDGVEEVSWSRLAHWLPELAQKIANDWRPEVVVGIAKAGVIPAVYLSSVFRLDFFPIKLSSRRNEDIISKEPRWHVRPGAYVRGKRVLLVDDICVAGRTFRLANAELAELGAAEVRTATLAIHSKSWRPNYYVSETDSLIVWPWDRDNLSADGTWYVNPEYAAEMHKVAGYVPGPSPALEPESR